MTGSGPVVFFLPGMDGTGDLFAPLVAALSNSFPTQIIRYPDRPDSYEDHIEFVRRQLPADRPFVLLGESYSGPIATALAASHPPGLRGLILCATFLSNPHSELAWLKPLVRRLPLRRLPIFLRHFLLTGGRDAPELDLLLVDVLGKVSLNTLKVRLLGVADVDVTAVAREVLVPCLYLRASHDRLVPRRCSARVLAAMPQAYVVDIAAPHLLLQANPAAAAVAIRAFLAEC